MNVVEVLVHLSLVLVLIYFAVLDLLQALFGCFGLRSLFVTTRAVHDVDTTDLLEREFYKPVSILVPACNQEAGIVAGVRSLLALHFPRFEVVVADDGSTDATVDRLVNAFALVEVPQIYRRRLETKEVHRVYRSLRHPNLTVIEKERGGRSDSLNAGVNVARYPLVCSVDAGTLLEAEALLRASRRFLEDDAVVGVGGTVRPLNGAVVREGHVVEVKVPRGWVERFQFLEFARGLFTGRAGWARFGTVPLVCGAFGLFRRESVIDVGGYGAQSDTEELELLMRIHQQYRVAGRPYRIGFHPDPICWTEVPPDLPSVRGRQHRWHLGLREALWRYRGMLLNPRYGKVGLLGLPYCWVFEAIRPVVEVTGYAALAAAFALGFLTAPFAVLFVALASLYRILLTHMAVAIDTALIRASWRDRLALFPTAILEFLGYHQIMAVERSRAMLRLRGTRGIEGPVNRSKLAGPGKRRRFRPEVRTRSADAVPPRVAGRRFEGPG